MGTLGRLCRAFSNNVSISRATVFPGLASRCIATSQTRHDIMEFFDEKKNYGEMEIQVGRSWRQDELRIKSNSDLHKLWYVLLKERNMLLTMEAECDRQVELFPNPERIDKVKESMKNLETVVRERNTAYHLLETGSDGERPVKTVVNEIGIRHNYKAAEHVIPRFLNAHWKRTRKFHYDGCAVRKFLRQMREKVSLEDHEKTRREKHKICNILRRYPKMDVSILKEQYPHIDIDQLRSTKRARGHCINDAP